MLGYGKEMVREMRFNSILSIRGPRNPTYKNGYLFRSNCKLWTVYS